ncbi:MAG: hypothetical protein PVI88_00105 [Nitrosopumilaceae archaeon]|jgi:hypothetical protein
MNINQLTPEEFRLKIAGLLDPLGQMDDLGKKSMEDEVIRFVSILPEVFGDNLDRKTLWERIGNGLVSSLAKAGGDVELFVNHCLDYVKADSGKAAANENLHYFISTLSTRDKEWKQQFLRTIEKKHYLIIVKSRDTWNKNKKGGTK